MTDSASASATPVKGINWKQGLLIAMGVPILIVPSLADLSLTLWAMSIAIWVISVVSGFFLNLTLGEMCATFGTAGMGGSIQYVFQNDEKYRSSKINKGRLIGAIGAWDYFTAWTPVIPIFTIMTAEYIINYVSLSIDDMTKMAMYLVLGAAIYGFIIITARKGLESGAKVQTIFTVVTIVPIVVIVLSPLFLGHFHPEHITNELTPAGWKWDANGILMVFGCLAVAQWSACGWETAAAHGAKYENPATDVPKALMACGLACLALYALISVCMYGTLGQAQIADAGAATLVPIAKTCFGEYGGLIAVILLIVGMVMIIQTAFLGAASTLQAMAEEGNMPACFTKTNSYGVPMNSLYFEAAIGFGLIILGVTASQMLAVCSVGYAITHCMVQLAFVKSRHYRRFKDLESPYKVGKFLYIMSFVMIGFDLLLVAGLLYYLNHEMGIIYCAMGIIFTLLYIPIWYAIQVSNHKNHPEIVCGLNYDLK
ncbi:MAG: APC family permease [archaeon]|nr:APC family permease [archaeon]